MHNYDNNRSDIVELVFTTKLFPNIVVMASLYRNSEHSQSIESSFSQSMSHNQSNGNEPSSSVSFLADNREILKKIQPTTMKLMSSDQENSVSLRQMNPKYPRGRFVRVNSRDDIDNISYNHYKEQSVSKSKSKTKSKTRTKSKTNIHRKNCCGYPEHKSDEIVNNRSNIKDTTTQKDDDNNNNNNINDNQSKICHQDNEIEIEPSTKMQTLINDILSWNDELTEGDLPNKAVVFSQWTSVLDLLQICLKKQEIQYERIDGSMSVKQRINAMDNFKNMDKNIKIILVSLKAGCEGIDLCVANHVYLLDPWWNPSTEDQAIDRVHRLGQTRTVYVNHFVIKDSVEEKILKIQERKRELISSTLQCNLEMKRNRGRELLNDLKELFDF